MKKLGNALLKSMVALMIMIPHPLLADECFKECATLIDLADTHIKNLESSLSAQERLNKLLEKRAQLMDEHIQDLEKSNKAWYRNPITMISLGFLGGAILVGNIK